MRRRPLFTDDQQWSFKRRTYNALILDAIGLSPCTHDPGIVEGNTSDDVDALRLELSGLGDEAGEVLS